MLYRPGVASDRASVGAAHIDQVITNAAPLPFPLEAKIDQTGEPVLLMQTCNWQGQSPANIGIDARGKQFLATFEEVTVLDARGVPNATVEKIREQRTGATSSTFNEVRR